MRKVAAILILFFAVLCEKIEGDPQERVFVGYFGSWVQKGEKGCTIQPHNIDPNQYTHIIMAFSSFSEKGILQIGNDTRLLQSLNDLKNSNPKLKILTSMGGASTVPKTWTKVIQNPDSRRNLIASSIRFCRKYNIDGIDIDWEFPQSDEGDMAQDFFSDMRKAIHREGQISIKGKLILTSASPPYVKTFDAYRPEKLQHYVDFFNVMFYDYHGAWNNVTGANTALYGEGVYNINATLTEYLARGTHPQKLVFGFANYGRTWTVLDENGMGQKATGGGEAGHCVHHKGVLIAPELDRVIKSSGFEEHWDETSKTPFGTYGKNFVTYDNERSIDEKMKVIKGLGLRGAMLWQIHNSKRVSDYISKTLQSL